jgi:hypothetical protein
MRRAVTRGEGMAYREQIQQRVVRLRDSAAYQSYLDVRAEVFRLMDAWDRSPECGPSAYWQEEINGFAYLFDASPLLIDRLREQCYHITGLKSYEYRTHHRHRAQQFENKFKMLEAVDPAGLFVPEAPELGGFGFDFGRGLVNIDTLKFYEVMIGLEKSGALRDFRGDARRTVVEIGSGWGGFAYHFKKLFPNTTYICVDLPPTMLFSGVYLKTLFPDAKFLFHDEDGFAENAHRLDSYDFVFLPHFSFAELRPSRLDLAINMVSFQEMTTGQVEGYVRALRAGGCGRLYSMNRDRSKHNTELSTVREVIARQYPVRNIEVLDIQYTELTPPKGPRKPPGVFDYVHCLAGE